MTISFQKLLSDCLVALGDSDASTWSRVDIIWPWAIEAMLELPILRPQHQDVTVAGAATHAIDLTADFREIINVEYPLSQDPPEYLTRMNRLDPNFYASDDHYDVDRNYEDGTGWVLWTSKLMAIGAQLKVNYLANHNTDLEDDPASYISVPDEYENILVANVVMRAYRERLGAYMQDPTGHMSIIQQMVHMVEAAEQNYKDLVLRAQEKLTQSIKSPHLASDKYDRVY